MCDGHLQLGAASYSWVHTINNLNLQWASQPLTNSRAGICRLKQTCWNSAHYSNQHINLITYARGVGVEFTLRDNWYLVVEHALSTDKARM